MTLSGEILKDERDGIEASYPPLQCIECGRRFVNGRCDACMNTVGTAELPPDFFFRPTRQPS